MRLRTSRQVAIIGVVLLSGSSAFLPLPVTSKPRRVFAAEEPSSTDDCSNAADCVHVSNVRMDDGGSDLTNRFKYKVNALMGAFDPASAEVDNERENGHILNAMLKFPALHTFVAVGKTLDQSEKDALETAVRSIIADEMGHTDIVCRIAPRGERFTKFTIEAMVSSADVITTVNSRLEALDRVVMNF